MNPTLRGDSNKVTLKQRTWLFNSNFLLKKKKKITEAVTIEHNCSGEDKYKKKIQASEKHFHLEICLVSLEKSKQSNEIKKKMYIFLK